MAATSASAAQPTSREESKSFWINEDYTYYPGSYDLELITERSGPPLFIAINRANMHKWIAQLDRAFFAKNMSHRIFRAETMCETLRKMIEERHYTCALNPTDPQHARDESSVSLLRVVFTIEITNGIITISDAVIIDAYYADVDRADTRLKYLEPRVTALERREQVLQEMEIVARMSEYEHQFAPIRQLYMQGARTIAREHGLPNRMRASFACGWSLRRANIFCKKWPILPLYFPAVVRNVSLATTCGLALQHIDAQYLVIDDYETTTEFNLTAIHGRYHDYHDTYIATNFAFHPNLRAIILYRAALVHPTTYCAEIYTIAHLLAYVKSTRIRLFIDSKIVKELRCEPEFMANVTPIDGNTDWRTILSDHFDTFEQDFARAEADVRAKMTMKMFPNLGPDDFAQGMRTHPMMQSTFLSWEAEMRELRQKTRELESELSRAQESAKLAEQFDRLRQQTVFRDIMTLMESFINSAPDKEEFRQASGHIREIIDQMDKK